MMDYSVTVLGRAVIVSYVTYPCLDRSRRGADDTAGPVCKHGAYLMGHFSEIDLLLYIRFPSWYK
jgi:hypothetical protein